VNPPEGESFVAGEVRLLTALAKALEKGPGTSIGVVARPMEFGLLRARIDGRPTSELWTIVEDGPASARAQVRIPELRARVESLKASV